MKSSPLGSSPPQPVDRDAGCDNPEAEEGRGGIVEEAVEEHDGGDQKEKDGHHRVSPGPVGAMQLGAFSA